MYARVYNNIIVWLQTSGISAMMYDWVKLLLIMCLCECVELVLMFGDSESFLMDR